MFLTNWVISLTSFSAIFLLSCSSTCINGKKTIQIHQSSKCLPFNPGGDNLKASKTSRRKCKKRCMENENCLAFQHKRKKKRCVLFFYKPEEVVTANNKFICGIVNDDAITQPSSTPTTEMNELPTVAPSSTWISEDRWMSYGRVDFSTTNSQFTSRI